MLVGSLCYLHQKNHPIRKPAVCFLARRSSCSMMYITLINGCQLRQARWIGLDSVYSIHSWLYFIDVCAWHGLAVDVIIHFYSMMNSIYNFRDWHWEWWRRPASRAAMTTMTMIDSFESTSYSYPYAELYSCTGSTGVDFRFIRSACIPVLQRFFYL